MRHGMNLRPEAQQLRSRGRRGDTVLAHINPAEAAYLAKHGGYDINPETGLPSFGLFKSIKKLAGNFIRHPVKSIARMAPAVLGNMAFGIPGAIAAGAAHGATTRGGGNKLAGALQGALGGAATGYGLQKAGQLFGVSPSSMMGQGLGMGHAGIPGALAKLGLTGQGGLGGLLGSKGAAAAGTAAAAQAAQAGGAGAAQAAAQGVPEEASWLSRTLNNPWVQGGLAATLVGGSLLGKSKYAEGTSLDEARDLLEADRQRMESRRNKEYYGTMKPVKRRRLSQQESEEKHRKGLGYSYFEDVNPEPEYYARGGHVGYIHGNSSGRADDVLTELPPDSFVWNSTDVSLLGDGNTASGIKQLQALDAKYAPIGRRYETGRHYDRGGGVHAKVSSGEYVSRPETVIGIGKGNPRKGAAIIQAGRQNLRKHKGVKSILPPRAKNVESYLR
jgi:hypothetical protein